MQPLRKFLIYPCEVSMSGKRVPFQQGKVTRAIKGARAAGMEVAACEIRPDGAIVLHHKPVERAETLDPLDKWVEEYRARST